MYGQQSKPTKIKYFLRFKEYAINRVASNGTYIVIVSYNRLLIGFDKYKIGVDYYAVRSGNKFYVTMPLHVHIVLLFQCLYYIVDVFIIQSRLISPQFFKQINI